MSNSIQATILSLITLSFSLAAQGYPPAQPTAPTDAPTADTPSAGSALPEGTIALRRHQILDQQMGGAVSHTMLVPQGWKLDAAPFWTGDPGTLVEFRAATHLQCVATGGEAADHERAIDGDRATEGLSEPRRVEERTRRRRVFRQSRQSQHCEPDERSTPRSNRAR